MKSLSFIIAAALISGHALACKADRILDHRTDAQRQAQISSPSNPRLPVVRNIAKDRVQELILLSIDMSFKVDISQITFDQSVYSPPLCMDDVDVVSLLMEMEDLLNIRISDAEADELTRIGRQRITLSVLERMLKSKLPQ